MPTVLIVDDEPAIRWLLGGILESEGLEVVTAEDGEAALETVRPDHPAVILLDLKMPKLNGMEVLEKIKALNPQVPVIILTAYGDVPTAVQAMRLGAYDFLTKPFQNDEIIFTVRRALERQELQLQVEELRSELAAGGALRELMGTSPRILMVFRQIQQVARTDFTVILQGETGTGKEIVARAIHQQSTRHEKPLIALDCGAIPETLIESELFGYERGAFTGADQRKEGHFQLADGGTLFLDEIANLALTTQSKLLRVLQERRVQPLGGNRAVPVNVRIIAASNVSLEAEMRTGRFRQDLYYRLNEFTIALPPLRERPEDILHLARRFLEEASMEFKKPLRGFSEGAIQLLLQYPWPGNARELKNVIRRAALLSSDLVGTEHLSALVRSGEAQPVADLPQEGYALREILARVIEEAERQAIRRALQKAKGNKSQAAKLLGVDYKTLHIKVKRYGVQTREFL